MRSLLLIGYSSINDDYDLLFKPNYRHQLECIYVEVIERETWKRWIVFGHMYPMYFCDGELLIG
jgi:hypothetical protein